MKTLWLGKDDCYVVFDTKEHKDILGIPLSKEYEVEMHMTDAEYEDYTRCRANWYRWQKRMSDHFDANARFLVR